MNNVDKLDELRKLAVTKGFPRELDKQFYIPVRIRNDDRSYIPANGEHVLLFDPQWIRYLVGSEVVDSEFIDKEKLEPITMPAYESMMVDLARIRAQKGDAIGYLFEKAKRGEK